MNKVLNEQEREMFCGASAETPQREEAELKLWKRVRSLVRDDQDEINKIADQQIQKREAELLDLWRSWSQSRATEASRFPKTTTRVSAGFSAGFQETAVPRAGQPAMATGKTRTRASST